jgi:hypothetical protein
MSNKEADLAWLIKIGQVKENAVTPKATTKTDEE